MKKLLDSLENAQKTWVELNKDAKEARKLFEDYQPEEDLVKREKITYTGSTRDFVLRVLPLFMDPHFRVNGKPNMEAMARVLDEVFEVRPEGRGEPIRFRSLLSLIQEERSKANE